VDPEWISSSRRRLPRLPRRRQTTRHQPSTDTYKLQHLS